VNIPKERKKSSENEERSYFYKIGSESSGLGLLIVAGMQNRLRGM